MSFNQVSSVYWLMAYMDELWQEKDLLSKLESRFIHLLQREIDIQKELDKDLEANVTEGLQTMNLQDVATIENFYNYSEHLQSNSTNLDQILRMIDQAKYWDKSEKDRKWFHF